MNEEEKTLLLQLILEDLRGNWGYNAEVRAMKAGELAKEIGLTKHYERTQSYIKESSEYGDWDGRYFRCSKEIGGYEGMDEMHGLPKTLKDKSEEFKKEALDILTYPEYRFDDYEERND
jgi:hypothetical protein